MTPAGVEPATSRFVAQHLNHCATAVPSNNMERHFKLVSQIRSWYSWQCTSMYVTFVQNKIWKLVSS